MRITVNNEEIDYTLEGEQNLFEVLEGLRSWLEPQGYAIRSARSGGRPLDLASTAQLKATSIEEVDSLDLEAESALKQTYDDLAAVDEYFRLLKAGIEAADTGVVARLAKEFDHLEAGLDGVLARSAIADERLTAAALASIVGPTGLLEHYTVEGEARAKLFAYIDALRGAIASRLREMEEPGRELAAAASELSESVDQLNDVSIMLQTGRDEEAMQAIVRFAELSSRIVRLYPLLKQSGGVDFNEIVLDGVSFPDFYADFNGMLGELLEAFGAEDSVLIGDLLEYEIAPRLEKLRGFIALLTGS